MPENTPDTETTGAQDPGQGAPSSGGGERTFTQPELEAILGDRLARERAKFADYEDLKGKASKYDEYQASQQTDLEKLQGQYEELLGKHSQTEHRLRITRAAAKHGLSEDAAAFLHGETDEEVDAAAAKLAALTSAATNGGESDGGHRRPDPSQGQGSSGDGANSIAAGADRYRRTKTTTS